MAGVGIPLPRTVAIFHEKRRYFDGIPCFADTGALAQFLRENREWPLFAKPVQGAYGKGTALIEGYDSAADALALAHEALSPGRYLRAATAEPRAAWASCSSRCWRRIRLWCRYAACVCRASAP